MGFAWIILAPVIIYFLVTSAIHNISSGGTKDINQPVPWVIIIGIFAQRHIVKGLTVGAVKGGGRR